MSILNNPSDGLYNMVAVLYRAIAQLGVTPREQLVEFCTAGVDHRPGNPKVGDALARWLELGLFELTPEGVRIGSAYAPPIGADDVVLTETLRRAALRVALAPQNIGNIWSTQGSADFARGIAWLLSQDAYRVDTSTGALLRLETNQVANRDRRIVSNDVRMNRLRDWAVFLGFAWSTPRSIVVDPTLAIDRVLEDALPNPDQQVPASDFLLALSSTLPVLDRGACRLAVEAELRPAVWPAIPAGWVSSALGRALRRLEHVGRLTLVSRADAGDALLIPGMAGTGERPIAQFTHVARPKAGK